MEGYSRGLIHNLTHVSIILPAWSKTFLPLGTGVAD